jgi:hypothetical protein
MRELVEHPSSRAGDLLSFYHEALFAASESNANHPHNPIRRVHKWCMMRATSERDGFLAHTPPAPQPTVPPVAPDRLTKYAPSEAVEGAFACLAGQGGDLSDEQADSAARSLCRAFGIGLRRTKYEMSVNFNKYLCL